MKHLPTFKRPGAHRHHRARLGRCRHRSRRAGPGRWPPTAASPSRRRRLCPPAPARSRTSTRSRPPSRATTATPRPRRRPGPDVRTAPRRRRSCTSTAPTAPTPTRSRASPADAGKYLAHEAKPQQKHSRHAGDPVRHRRHDAEHLQLRDLQQLRLQPDHQRLLRQRRLRRRLPGRSGHGRPRAEGPGQGLQGVLPHRSPARRSAPAPWPTSSDAGYSRRPTPRLPQGQRPAAAGCRAARPRAPGRSTSR